MENLPIKIKFHFCLVWFIDGELMSEDLNVDWAGHIFVSFKGHMAHEKSFLLKNTFEKFENKIKFEFRLVKRQR